MGAKLPPFAIADTDGTPTVWQPTQIFFPNGLVTDIGNGTVFINTGAGGTGETLEARTPLLKAGTVLSLNTDGNTANFLRGDGVFAAPPTGKVYAGTGVYYIVQTNNDPTLLNVQQLASLTNGIIKNTSGTGVLSVASGGVDYENILTAATPLLRRANVFSLQTDGLTATYLRGDGTYRSVYEARSPLLSAGTILSILTDGTTTNFMRGDGALAVPASNSGIKCILFTVYSDASWVAEAVPIGQSPFETPITVKQVNVAADGSSPTIAFNIEHRVWGNLATSGTGLFSANQTATTAGFQSVSFTSANFPARAHIFLTTSAVTIGQADYITGSVYYTRDSI